MKTRADEKDFRRWLGCVSTDRDLVFLNARAKDISLPVPVLTAEEVKRRGVELWSLNNRSWYGYALHRAAYCAVMPKGAIEALDEKTLKHLATMQIQLDVRSVVPNSKLSKTTRSKILNFSTNGWVTSSGWSSLADVERIEVFNAWYSHSEITYYETVQLEEMPAGARTELKRTGLASRLNKFASESGANCFATAAACIAKRSDSAPAAAVSNEWMHWPKFEQLLASANYRVAKSRMATARDVVVFSEKGKVVHAGYALSSEFYFEKPGQDFYEPYRIAKFSNASREWPKTALTIYRQT